MKKERGITLIGLVIMVIIILIIAGVALSMITGDDNMFTKISNTQYKYAHSSVYEALQVESNKYQLDKYSGQTDKSFIGRLLEKQIIKQSTKNSQEYIINVEKLSGKKMDIGSGTDEETNVYKLVPTNLVSKVATISITKLAQENSTTEYYVMYYGNSGEEPVILGSIYDSYGEKIDPFAYFNYKENEKGEIEILGFNLDEFEGSDKYWSSSEEGTCFYTDYARMDIGETLVIPEEIDGKPVTKVSFMQNIEEGEKEYTIEMSTIKDIIFPKTVKSIDHITTYIIFNNLEKITLPENLEEIGYNAFGCSGNGYDYKLNSINIPNTVKKIGDYAFSGIVTNEITLPTNLEEIGRQVFRYTGTKINGISDTKLKTIGLGAFEHCKFDKDLHLPETLTQIGSYAFNHCGELGDIYIPKSVTKIGDKAFYINESSSSPTTYEHIYIQGKKSADEFEELGKDWYDPKAPDKIQYLGEE